MVISAMRTLKSAILPFLRVRHRHVLTGPVDSSVAEPSLPTPTPARSAADVTWGAAFLMATSAIGPGFLTQTAVFTQAFGADFAFAILASVLVDIAAQVNVWRVLGVARRRGHELASDLVPGLGVLISTLVILGGLVFNIGNVAGCGLGLAVFGMPVGVGAALSALLAAVLLAFPAAGRTLDVVAKGLGAVMILLTAGVMLVSGPDYLAALRGSVLPGRLEMLPVLTLVGGTVGGYITFAGAHRLLDAGVGGPEDVPRLTRAAVLGTVVTAAMRVLLFLAVLGVIGAGRVLDPGNPAADAFRQGAGEWGYRFFGVVLWCAAITSVIGCTYTSLTFAGRWAREGLRPAVVQAAFIAFSAVLFLGVGRPVRLLVLAGGLNGLILPVTLGVVLVAARRPSLLGGVRVPVGWQAAGWLAWLASVVAGVLAFRAMVRG
jgi:Mn2+/Fe2+ NRAMP family transporter